MEGERGRRVRVVMLNGWVDRSREWTIEEPVRPVAPANVTGVGVVMVLWIIRTEVHKRSLRSQKCQQKVRELSPSELSG